MYPATDRIVEGNVIFCDQGAAGGCGAETSQTDALRGGVGDQRTGAAEQLHAGKLAQFAVERDGGCSGELVAGEFAGAGRTFKRTQRRPVGGDSDLLPGSRRLQLHGCSGCQGNTAGNKSWRGNAEGTRKSAGNGQGSIGTGAAQDISGHARHNSAREHGALRIFDGDLNLRRRRRAKANRARQASGQQEHQRMKNRFTPGQLHNVVSVVPRK